MQEWIREIRQAEVTLVPETKRRGDGEIDQQEDPVTDALQRPGDLHSRRCDGIQVVRNLKLNYFRSKLVTHFDIAYKRGEVVWPKRTGRPVPINNI
jgi:hypothetical protein